MVAMES